MLPRALRSMFAIILLALCVGVRVPSQPARAADSVPQHATALAQQGALGAHQSAYGDTERNGSALSGLASYALCVGLFLTVIAVLGLHACRRAANPYPMRRYRRRL